MKLINYNSELAPIMRDEFITSMDSLFDKLFKDSFPSVSKELGDGFFSKSSYPRVNVIDYHDYIEIEAEIPGLKKEEISVDLTDNVLTISGEKKKTKKENFENGTFLYKELKHSSFKRNFTLGDNIEKTNISADFNDGILQIRLNKIKSTEPKKVKIL